ncbi:MAG: diguanylate cyclase [Ruminococcus sp.]|nr:diguanylate cyclase [Oscillospiraceae bacterium]MDY4414666.1 diguanylate cyclase [Ruminococcus sp.]
MTKGKNNSNEKGYVIAGIIFAVVLLISLGQFIFLYTMQSQNSLKAEKEQKAVSEIKENLISINRDVLKIISGVGNAQSIANDIEISFDNIDKSMADYEQTDYHTKKELVRYEEAKNYISALRSRLLEYQSQLSDINIEDAKNIYTQEINIFQQSAIDKFNSAMDINVNYIKEQKEKSIMFFKIVIGIMSALLVFGEIGIIITAKISKKARAEISEKQKQAESANKKFKRSQEKIEDIVYKNILTGMKNRYALEKDIGERLQSEPFNMALFDMDNFRSINDTYGYDFGDEYLVQIAEKLQKSFGEYAEIYNITGNEFFVLFNSDISKEKSINLSKNIFTAIGMAYSVGNIGIQLSVSGCAYNYLPGDCSSLDSLLVKMNNTIRNIKKNGGNSMASVTNI